ncbi:MAG: hypothetical protein GX230_09685 [Lentisphaerae bacterium]|nr:hypothetical protein [Lentisphaerota bacterium]
MLVNDLSDYDEFFDIGWVHIYDCGPPQTNILAAADLPDHTPITLEETETLHHCAKTNLNVYVGFGHNNVNTSNLVLIATHTEESYQRTQHCLGVVWAENGSLDLASLLADNALPYLDQICFTTNGATVAGNILQYASSPPDDMAPAIYAINVVRLADAAILDRLWLVVNSSLTRTVFNACYEQNSANMNWVLTLPSPYSTIELNQEGQPVDPEPGAPNQWAGPTRVATFLHHDAAYEMRTANQGDHGHQAMYDAQGNLITSTIAAGTADRERPILFWGIPNWTNHRNVDVRPFIRALQLDGNPVLPNSQNVPRNLNRPCIYQGTHADQYIQCRPITPTGTIPRP